MHSLRTGKGTMTTIGDGDDDDGDGDDDCRLVECSAPGTSDAHGPIRLSK